MSLLHFSPKASALTPREMHGREKFAEGAQKKSKRVLLFDFCIYAKTLITSTLQSFQYAVNYPPNQLPAEDTNPIGSLTS
jgi:hypothetical protein